MKFINWSHVDFSRNKRATSQSNAIETLADERAMQPILNVSLIIHHVHNGTYRHTHTHTARRRFCLLLSHYLLGNCKIGFRGCTLRFEWTFRIRPKPCHLYALKMNYVLCVRLSVCVYASRIAYGLAHASKSSQPE